MAVELTVDGIAKQWPISSRDPKAMIDFAQSALTTAYYIGCSMGNRDVARERLVEARAYIDAAFAALDDQGSPR